MQATAERPASHRQTADKHSNALRRIQMHSNAFKCIPNTQMHSNAWRCAQKHSDALKRTPIHSNARSIAFKCIQVHQMH